MNIQYNNWNLINLSQLQSAFDTGLTEFFDLFYTFDPTFIATSSNTRVTGTTFNGYNFELRGNHFTDAVPLETLTYLSLSNANTSLLATGNVTLDENSLSYYGYYDKFLLISPTTNLLLLGNVNVDSSGNPSNGMQTQVSVTHNGFTASYFGNILLDANSAISGGTITSFTLSDDAGHSLSVSGASLDAVTFDMLADPVTGNIIDLFDYVASATNLAGNDVMTGGAGDDTFNGYAGNDTLNGGAGVDTLIGGTGDDTYITDGTDIITELANEGNDTIQSSVTYTLSTANVENLTLTGTAAINGTGDIAANSITGNLASNTLNGGAGNDTLDGGVSDVLNTGMVDTLNGDAGNDTFLVRGFYGAGIYNGGTDTDTLDFGQANAYTAGRRVAERAGVNVNLDTGAGTGIASTYYVKTTGFIWPDAAGRITLTGIENVIGTNQSDLITGDANNNVLDGGVSDVYNPGVIDTLNGAAGNDTFLVRGFYGAGIYNGGTDTDTLDFSQANAYTAGRRVAEGAGVSVNLGTGSATTYYLKATGFTWADANGQIALSGIENVRGTNQGDILIGDANANTLEGGAGNDTLNGGAGVDTLIGGAGADLFDFNAISESSVGIARDVIADFSSVELDLIDLSTIDADTILANNQAFNFIGNDAAFSNAAGELRFDSASHSVFGDVDGDSVADFQIELTGVNSLQATDFIL